MSDMILDVDDFLMRVQNDTELLLELLDIFVNDFHKKRQELQEALEKGDAEAVEHIAHFLKGSCGNISAKPLRDIFLELEKKGSMGVVENLDKELEDIDNKFEALAVRIGELRAKFQ